MSRRTALGVLAAAAAAVVAGCTTEQGRPQARRRRHVEPEIDPDVTVAAEALAQQQSVLALVEATQQRHKALATRLASTAAVHRAHVAVLAKAVPRGTPTPAVPSSTGPGRGSASPSPGASAGPSPAQGADRATPVPGSAAQAIQQVVLAEQGLRTSTKQLAAKARSGAFARALASMAAAAAQQAVVLASTTAGKVRP